jgi:hypothetical protein
MPGKSLTPAEMREIQRLAGEGESRRAIAAATGRHIDTVSDYLKRIRLDPARARIRVEDLPGPIPLRELGPHASRALEDYAYFRLYYFGHISRPWQVEAANLILRLLATEDREYVVYNAPPGTGKSTDKVDLAAWLTCHNRAIRGLFGSDVATNAARDLKRLRRAFERTFPAKARDFDLRYGAAEDAKGCLAIDFGRFRPLATDTWRDDAYIVEQFGEDAVVEKEPTWSSYGRDSGVLGNRFDYADWDDLVTKTNMRTIDARDRLRHDWDTELEPRLEPRGLHVLRGQRMGADDLFRYNLDKVTDELGVDDEGNEVVLATKPKYHHICYRAHDEQRCLSGAKGSHLRTAVPWNPDGTGGCLLDPVRLPWTDCRSIMVNTPRTWAVQYQQEDAELEDTLIARAWIDGTEDDDGVHPGCLDPERGFRELPAGIRGPMAHVACVDPSASKWWGITRWAYAAPSQLRFLMDLCNERMEGPKLLDWDPDRGCHTGLMEDWQQNSVEDGMFITHWVIETVAFQKWLIQYNHFQTWLKPLYRKGMVRLPWARSSRPHVQRLVTQLTRWSEEIARSNGRQVEDLVMSNWFLEVKLPTIAPAVEHHEPVYLHRPSWMTGRQGRPVEPGWATVESPYEADLRARRGA